MADKRDLWIKCNICGRVISYEDLASGKASHKMITPDTEFSQETWKNLCRDHNKVTEHDIQK